MSNKMLPHVEVSRQEFKRLFIEAGLSEFRAEIQALTSESIGTYFRVGNRMIRSLGRENGNGTFTKNETEGMD